jgi:hypothetical protein
VKDPSKEDWERLRRYGSWMRELYLSESHPDEGELVPTYNDEPIIGRNVFTQLSLASPTGLVCSGLRKLKWHSSRHWLPSLRHFLPPTLAEIEIFTTPSDGPFGVPPPTIPVLPGACLRSLRLTFHPADSEAVRNSASVTILRCCAFLERLETSAQLSEAAVSHLVGLRYLRTLRMGSDPPPDLFISSDTFPSLETLILDNGVGHKWLSLLGAARENGSADGDSTTSVGTRATLTGLYCLGGMTVDPTIISSLCTFQKLTHVFIDGACSTGGGCTFLLTDDDLAKLANALPDIKSLRLGSPCPANRCRTTILSLFMLSTRCLRLKTLEIHFNTTGINHDFERLFEEPQNKTMRSLPRCPLRCLTVADTPIPGDDAGLVAICLSGIFCELRGFRGHHRKWAEASRMARSLYSFRLAVAPNTCIVSTTLWHPRLVDRSLKFGTVRVVAS